MKIQLVSDLHLEFSDITIPNVGGTDVLILGGDILVANKLMGSNSAQTQVFHNFLARCSAEFPHVVYVAGNHEFYGDKFHSAIDDLRYYTQQHYNNVHFLECDTKIIDDVVFVGGTLWTSMNNSDPLTIQAVHSSMNDYHNIVDDSRGYAKLQPTETVIRHHNTLQYFKVQLQKYVNHKCVVVTHHAPHAQSSHPRYCDDYFVGGAYHSDLSEFVLDHPQIKLWTCGHVHYAHQYNIGPTLVACNPRGYQNHSYTEQTGFDPLLQLDLDQLVATS